MSIVDQVKKLVPVELRPRRQIKAYRQYKKASSEWRSLLQRETGRRYRDVPMGPTGPKEIISKTALMNREEIQVKSLRNVYLASGCATMTEFLHAACSAGFQLADAQAAFELGCGSARLIRHLRGIEGLRLVGSDLIEDNVRWCNDHLPGMEFYTNKLQPPLDFAEDGTFDFAFAFSVFTHIPGELQLPWVAELARILKPGGIATITILGDEMARKMMNEEEFEQYQDEGTYTMDANHPRVSASSALIGSWDIFMTTSYMTELYSQALEVVEQRPGSQSIVTLRKPGG
jgi:SAM-dependent methyltransferase